MTSSVAMPLLPRKPSIPDVKKTVYCYFVFSHIAQVTKGLPEKVVSVQKILFLFVPKKKNSSHKRGFREMASSQENRSFVYDLNGELLLVLCYESEGYDIP